MIFRYQKMRDVRRALFFFYHRRVNRQLDGILDPQYFWHNLTVAEPTKDSFHFQFKPAFGTSAQHFLRRAQPYLGTRALELGAASGWLKNEWRITDYVGVDRSKFARPFQTALRTKALANGVRLGTRVSRVVRRLGRERAFDSIICFESFHAFPDEALRVARSPLLRDHGTLILVDALAWWPKRLNIEKYGFESVYSEVIPVDYLDYDRAAREILGTLSRWEQARIPRRIMLEASRALGKDFVDAFLRGVPIAELPHAGRRTGFDPNLRYGVFVYRKLPSSRRTTRSFNIWENFRAPRELRWSALAKSSRTTPDPTRKS